MAEIKTCWLPDCPYPATGRGEYPRACWSHTPEEDYRYPVLVEYTHEHVVWVAAPSQADAARYLQDAPYEHTNDSETLLSAYWSVKAPDKWDWSTIQYGGQSCPSTDADAHVQTHRAHLARIDREVKQAACAEAGHPNVETSVSGRRWCPVCYSLPALEPEAATS